VFQRNARSRKRKPRIHSSRGGFRRADFEALESRQLLSVSLPAIAAQTVLAGASLNLALNGAATTGNAVDYTVAVTNSNLTNASGGSAQLTPAVMPSSNRSIEMVVNDPTDGKSNPTWIEIDGVSAAGADSYSWNTSNVSAGTYYLKGYMYTPSTGIAIFSGLTTSFTVTAAS
jgi:hypothetical protein